MISHSKHLPTTDNVSVELNWMSWIRETMASFFDQFKCLMCEPKIQLKTPDFFNHERPRHNFS